MSGCRRPVGTIYNISDHVVSAYTNSWKTPRVCISDTTQMRMLKMACETFQFYRRICKVTLKIYLVEGEEIKVKFCKNQQNPVSG